MKEQYKKLLEIIYQANRSDYSLEHVTKAILELNKYFDKIISDNKFDTFYQFFSNMPSITPLYIERDINDCLDITNFYLKLDENKKKLIDNIGFNITIDDVNNKQFFLSNNKFYLLKFFIQDTSMNEEQKIFLINDDFLFILNNTLKSKHSKLHGFLDKNVIESSITVYNDFIEKINPILEKNKIENELNTPAYNIKVGKNKL